jgi:elongation factor Tu
VIRGNAKGALDHPDDPAHAACITELLDALDTTIPDPKRDVDKPFLLAIEGVCQIEGRGIAVTGKIEQGRIRAGDKVEVLGLMEPFTTVCTQVEMFHRILDEGVAGQNVGLLLRGVRHNQVCRGQVVAAVGSIQPRQKFQAEVYALTKAEGGRHTPFFSGYAPQFYFRTTDVCGSACLMEGAEMCMPGDTVKMEVALGKPVAIEAGTRFAIREGGRTVGSGIVTEVG